MGVWSSVLEVKIKIMKNNGILMQQVHENIYGNVWSRKECAAHERV